MKICIQPIESKEQSKEVQKKIFKLGYGWGGKYKTIRDYNAVSLYLDTEDNSITYLSNSENTNSSNMILTPKEFLNADIDKSNWNSWTLLEKQEVPILTRWELLDIR